MPQYLSPGVYVEDPGYVEARLAWRNAGARIVPGRVDAQGLPLPTPESGLGTRDSPPRISSGC